MYALFYYLAQASSVTGIVWYKGLVNEFWPLPPRFAQVASECLHPYAFVERHRAIQCLVWHRAFAAHPLRRFHCVRQFRFADCRLGEQISLLTTLLHRGCVCARIEENQGLLSSSKLGGCLPDGPGQHRTKYQGILMFGTVRRSLVFGQALGPATALTPYSCELGSLFKAPCRV